MHQFLLVIPAEISFFVIPAPAGIQGFRFFVIPAQAGIQGAPTDSPGSPPPRR